MIAILEDEAGRTEVMTDLLNSHVPEADFLFFDNAPDMVGWLENHLAEVTLFSLDHDLGPTRERDGVSFDPGIGRDVVDFLETRRGTCPVIIHSSNGPAADGMLYALRFAGWTAERVYPHNDLAWIERDWLPRIRAIWSPS